MKSNLPQWVGSVAAVMSGGNSLLASVLGAVLVLAVAWRLLGLPLLAVWGACGSAERHQCMDRIVKNLERLSRGRRSPPPKSR